jgi:molecular chaperone GrpE
MNDSKTDLENPPSAGANDGIEAEDIAIQPDAAQLAALSAERDQLASEKAGLQELLLRRQADYDNFRKRAERDRSEYIEYAGMETLRPLLPIVDDFERALKAETTDKDYAKGMELIYQRMMEAMKKMGLEPIESTGKPFDPHIHHAVEMVDTDETEDNTVLATYQTGYNFRGRLLRPAMVKVAVRG